MANPTGYELSRLWFNWCFENPEKINPNHTALYFFCIEHCNRLGWKEKFGLPTTMAKEAIGIRSYNTYIKTLSDLVEFGFIILVEKSKNQYSSNIVALSNFDKAPNNALDKAFIKLLLKQGESTEQSISSIDKPLTIEPRTNSNNTVMPSAEFLKIIEQNEDDYLWLEQLVKKFKFDSTYQANLYVNKSFRKHIQEQSIDKGEELTFESVKHVRNAAEAWYKQSSESIAKTAKRKFVS